MMARRTKRKLEALAECGHRMVAHSEQMMPDMAAAPVWGAVLESWMKGPAADYICLECLALARDLDTEEPCPGRP